MKGLTKALHKFKLYRALKKRHLAVSPGAKKKKKKRAVKKKVAKRKVAKRQPAKKKAVKRKTSGSPKAVFVRKCMRSGCTKAQAEGLYKGQQTRKKNAAKKKR